MQLLELFSGTHSVGKIAESLNWNVISLDLNMPADIEEDIMTWNYKSFEPGFFDVIWASPVCSFWSKMKYLRVSKEKIQEDLIEYGEPMIDRLIKIINYLKPKYYFIENPRTGTMKDYITMLPYYDVDYCQYGFDYKKSTRIWTNLTKFKPKTCDAKTCKKMVKINNNYIHKKQLGNNHHHLHNKTQIEERYQIPPALIKGLFSYIK